MYVIYKSDSFEDAIRKTLLMGGDTDTNACIVGSVAEALYGMSEIQKEESLNNLPDKFKKVYR
ncbi:MAG: ADP-ribosylglycohydrolase family protein [bacterium]|nr:ADP-ribosylglycohydrolase family protein [bacterium]